MAASATPGFETLERTLAARHREVEAALRRLVEPSRAPAVAAAIEDSLFAPAKRLRPILALLVADLLRGDPASVLPAGCAIEDSLFAPAKRLRPILALLVADLLRGDPASVLPAGCAIEMVHTASLILDDLLRGDPASVLPAGCAIEMVHTASLILDDLPAMDDAKTRRGRPTCHVAHGEATAVLAAFALNNRAFEILAEGWEGGPDALVRGALARELARAIGQDGMIAGQSVDLQMEGRTIDFPTLEFIHSRKTGALFMASAATGATASRARPAEAAAVVAYAKNLGLAFQIVDDLIDATGGAAEAGKDVGQDARKTTFVSFAGTEGARALAEELIAVSIDALLPFGPRATPLRELARYVVTRRR